QLRSQAQPVTRKALAAITGQLEPMLETSLQQLARLAACPGGEVAEARQPLLYSPFALGQLVVRHDDDAGQSKGVGRQRQLGQILELRADQPAWCMKLQYPQLVRARWRWWAQSFRDHAAAGFQIQPQAACALLAQFAVWRQHIAKQQRVTRSELLTT